MSKCSWHGARYLIALSILFVEFLFYCYDADSKLKALREQRQRREEELRREAEREFLPSFSLFSLNYVVFALPIYSFIAFETFSRY